MPIIQPIISGGSSGPAYYIEKTVDANGVLKNTSSVIDLTGVTDIASYVLYYAYMGNSNITGVLNFSGIKKISGQSALGSTFYGCSGITGINMSSLEIASGTASMQDTFNGCENLVSFNLESLVYASSSQTQIFRKCRALTTGTFYSLKILDVGSLTGGFRDCTNLASLYFPALKTILGTNNTFNNMLSGVTGCTVHFPSNLDPQGGSTVVSSLPQYPNFGGTNTVLAFDLPATNLLTGVNTTVYERNPKYDTATALAWRVQDTGTIPNITIDWTPFYTSGLTDPTVGTTIYSDSACTVTVTTVDSIA